MKNKVSILAGRVGSNLRYLHPRAKREGLNPPCNAAITIVLVGFQPTLLFLLEFLDMKEHVRELIENDARQERQEIT